VATYDLSGRGVQALSNGVTALHVDILAEPLGPQLGEALPPNHFHVALLRFGDGTGWWRTTPVEGGPQWMGVPTGTVQLGYACQHQASIRVTEIIGGPEPFADR
jgi:hypothetical protein